MVIPKCSPAQKMALISDYTGWIVRSAAGHDKGELFCVVGTQGEFLLLCNGKQRKLSAPKRKKPRHVDFLEKPPDDPPRSDRELRRALAAFKGGNHAWQKTI